MSSHRATTLVELLVVVAVIGILATIGIVNLIQAQDRAQVSVVLSDLRLLSNGLASYYLDNNQFPPGAREDTVDDYPLLFVPVALTRLTTPVAYLSSLMAADPFSGAGSSAPGAFVSFEDVVSHSYVYIHYPDFSLYKGNPRLWRRGYAVTSLGPDQSDSYSVYRPFPSELPAEAQILGFHTVLDTIYDPTNGSRSGGDIVRFGGNLDSFPTG
ncbi:prepilin-type N-terminal cleavage/methylation domain-containing protein [Candidatus Sumerlaeota bacterium]|nr:prepilin-type N-terminal cleavage/methylation domain-containing protein [Candidatus Sumerlaeota bacterium]